METIYLAQIPDAFGYGLCVVHPDREQAKKALRKEYAKWRKSYQFDMSFEDALDYFGGGIEAIEIGKVYNDGFRE